jgi:hypothetical protein
MDYFDKLKYAEQQTDRHISWILLFNFIIYNIYVILYIYIWYILYVIIIIIIIIIC